MSKPLISVVVPIYNVESYLRCCIDSILAQTYKNLEIILVNDGSPDRCGQICGEYASNDDRIIVIHKENGGLSSARNAGLNIARGEYITHIDGDDHVAHDMIEYLMSLLARHDADISQCEFTTVNDGIFPKATDDTSFGKDVVLTGIEAMERLFMYEPPVSITTWGKLYKVRLYKEYGVTFPIGEVQEDNFVTYKLFYYASRVVCGGEVKYYYLKRSNSIMGSPFNSKHLHIVNAAEEAMDFVRGKSIHLTEKAMCNCIDVNFLSIDSIIEVRNLRKWRSELKNLRKNILRVAKERERLGMRLSHKKNAVRLLKIGYWVYIPARMLFVRLKK